MEPLNILILIHALLFLAVGGYAAYLDRHPSYAPDWTWITVAGGNAIILIALACVSWLTPFVPWPAVVIDLGLNSVAAIPIIRWQYKQARQREAERIAAKERLR